MAVLDLNKIHFDDCLNVLRSLPDASIDLMLQDPPYGVTQNKWDKAPDFSIMWQEWERVVKPNGAFIFTAQQPFTTDLILSRRGLFRYDLIWEKKGRATGFLNANRMPLRNHEHILVFYRSLPTYNPQKTKGEPNHKRGGGRGKTRMSNNYGKFDTSFESPQTDDKYPLSIVSFPSSHPPIHPTQKSIELFTWLIRTYSNEGDVVFDGYSGSGTTAIACIEENRNYICSENNIVYHEQSINRVESYKKMPTGQGQAF